MLLWITFSNNNKLSDDVLKCNANAAKLGKLPLGHISNNNLIFLLPGMFDDVAMLGRLPLDQIDQQRFDSIHWR